MIELRSCRCLSLKTILRCHCVILLDFTWILFQRSSKYVYGVHDRVKGVISWPITSIPLIVPRRFSLLWGCLGDRERSRAREPRGGGRGCDHRSSKIAKAETDRISFRLREVCVSYLPSPPNGTFLPSWFENGRNFYIKEHSCEDSNLNQLYCCCRLLIFVTSGAKVTVFFFSFLGECNASNCAVATVSTQPPAPKLVQ